MAVFRPGAVACIGNAAMDGSIEYGNHSPDPPTNRVRGHHLKSGVTGNTDLHASNASCHRSGLRLNACARNG
jgi:hypothetical protein